MTAVWLFTCSVVGVVCYFMGRWRAIARIGKVLIAYGDTMNQALIDTYRTEKKEEVLYELRGTNNLFEHLVDELRRM